MSRTSSSSEIGSRVERSLLRCLQWSQSGRHRRVLTEVERLLPRVARHPHLEAQLLVWKAQALLAMSCTDRALAAARRSWELEASPHACHLMCNALYALGDGDGCEDLLRSGREVFPEAVHLPIQLAMVLADQGRLPEALEVLEEIPADVALAEDLDPFVTGFRANLLATMSRWSEADALLKEGLGRDPDSEVLRDTFEEIDRAWRRSDARKELLRSWRSELSPLDGTDAEVDDAVIRCGAVLELDSLEVSAARRLWRALSRTGAVRPQAPEPWAAAMLLCVLELDGSAPSAAAIARATRCSAPTVRTAARRGRELLDGMSPEMRRRAFAAETNPRLDDPLEGGAPPRRASVVPFPTRD